MTERGGETNRGDWDIGSLITLVTNHCLVSTEYEGGAESSPVR